MVAGRRSRLERQDQRHHRYRDNLITTVTMQQYDATLAEEWFEVPATDVLAGRPVGLPGII
jgi:hypothetical protein